MAFLGLRTGGGGGGSGANAGATTGSTPTSQRGGRTGPEAGSGRVRAVVDSPTGSSAAAASPGAGRGAAERQAFAIIEERQRIRKRAAGNERTEENLDTSNTEQSDGSGYILGPVVATYIRGRFLGKGGFAKCYEMTDARTQRVYAGKIIDKSTVTKLRARQKLRSEIQIHGSLRHPHIVRFEHFFEDEDHVYILLELCDAQSMMELLKRRKRLTEPECRYFMMQILEAVEYMHRNRVIHRDIKLGNLFLTSDLQIKIGDFGLAAKLEYDNERKRTMCGTPNYIAPEILCGKNGHSYEVDIWSLGVVLYTMLIGKPPFETADVKTTYKRIKANIYTFPSQVQISRPARDLIVSILNAAPEGRPQLSDIWCSEFMQGPVPRCLPRKALDEEPTLAEIGLDFASGAVQAAGMRYHDSADGATGPRFPSAAQSVQQQACSSISARERNLPAVQGITQKGTFPRNPFTKKHIGTGPVAALEKPHAGSAPGNALGVVHLLERMELGTAEAPAHTAAERIHTDGSANLTPMSGARACAMPPPACESASRHDRQIIAAAGNDAGGHWDAADMDEEERGMLRRAQHELATSFARLPPEAMIPTSAARSASPSEVLGPPGARSGAQSRSSASSAACAQAGDQRGACGGGVLASPFQIADPTRTVHMGDLPADCKTTPPEVWICKWVDYTSKYGVGYQLSNGDYGVYFNDATKIMLHAGGDASAIEYVERKRLAFGSYDDWQIFTWNDHRESLRKKVTLLRHFRQHLDEHQPPGQEPPVAQGTVPGSAGAAAAVQRPIYLKRWMRTRHAMIFRLSNRVIQVDFFDTTQLVLSAGHGIVTYRDKLGRRIQLRLHAIPNCPELVKRLRYLRDILGHLTQQQQQQQQQPVPPAQV